MATPKKIKEQAQAADDVHAKLYPVEKAEPTEAAPTESSETPTETPTEGAPQAAPPTQDAAPTETLAASPEPAPGTPEWEHKYKTLQGKYNSEVPRIQTENDDLRAQVGNLQSILANFQQGGAVELKPGESLLRPEDIDDYGEDLIDVVKRAAREELNPEIARLNAENEQLRGNLGAVGAAAQHSAGENLYSGLDAAVPNWREINKSPAFIDWLAKKDVYSGSSRQQLLTAAFETKDTARVIAFFRGFKQEQTVTTPQTQGTDSIDPLDTLVAPGQPSATSAAGANKEGLIWSQADIANFYKAVNSGKFKGRDADKAAYERDIIAAGQQGRIIG